LRFLSIRRRWLRLIPPLCETCNAFAILCSHKGRCRHELARGTAAEHFREFYPIAYTLDAPFKKKEQPYRH